MDALDEYFAKINELERRRRENDWPSNGCQWIASTRGSVTERDFYLAPDGNIIVREENDGWRYLKRGPERTECVITPEEAMRQWPGICDAVRSAIAVRHEQESSCRNREPNE